MAHEEYLRNVPGADTAVLFVHGILGTPDHFREFVPLVPKEWSVCNILLPGHGGGVRDFSNSSMEQWRSTVDNWVDELLKTHSSIFIAAHSMGTLFALQQAVSRGDRIKGLFLLASPLRLWLRPQMAVNAMKVYSGRIRPEDAWACATRDACSVRQDKRIWLYCGWVPRYLELFREIRKTRNLLGKICVPCMVFQSRYDEMVSFRAVKELEAFPNIRTHVLKSSHHFYYDPEEFRSLLNQFSDFLKI